MPGPQTQHKGTVYGNDENAPKPGLGPPCAADRSTPTGGPHAVIPPGMTQLRVWVYQTGATVRVYM